MDINKTGNIYHIKCMADELQLLKTGIEDSIVANERSYLRLTDNGGADLDKDKHLSAVRQLIKFLENFKNNA